MALNKASLDLIKSFEGCVLNAYKDTGGVWTIGYGHTSAAGSPVVTPGMKITKQQAEEIFANDLKKYEAWVKEYVKVPVNQNQHGALTSFCYNLGPAQLKSSTLLKKLNKRDYLGASREFGKWVYDNGKRLKGLERRREAERVLFLTGGTIPMKEAQKVIDANKTPSKVSTPDKAPTPSTGLWDAITKILSKLFGGK